MNETEYCGTVLLAVCFVIQLLGAQVRAVVVAGGEGQGLTSARN